MSEWKEKTLSDMTNIVPGFAFKGEHFGDTGTVVIKIKDIIPPMIDLHGAQCVDSSLYSFQKLEKYRLYKGDYVVAMTGATIGKVGRLMEEGEAYINQRVAKIVPRNSVDRDFVYYCLVDSAFGDFVQNNIDSHSAQENISGTSIGRYLINSPPLHEQKAIASVLSSLDDKIDLLHRQNKTLEAMAETLFRQWFIEEAQDDWENGKIEDLFVLQRGFDLPSHVRNEGNFPIYAASGLNGFHDEYKIKAPGVTTGRSGLLGKVFFIQDDFWPLNTSLFIKEFCRATPLFSYCLLTSLDLESFNSGSAVPTLNRNHVHDCELIIPPKDLIDKFESVMIANFLKIKENQKQIRTLQQLRDNLLPKLMSGEVRVNYE